MQSDSLFKGFDGFGAFTSLPCYKAVPSLNMSHNLCIRPRRNFTCEFKRVLVMSELT